MRVPAVLTVVLGMLVAPDAQAASALVNPYVRVTAETHEGLTVRGNNGTINLGDAVVRNINIAGGVLVLLWPNATLRYSFAPTLAPVKRALFRDACKVWESATMVRCVESPAGAYVAVVREFAAGQSACGGSPAGCASLGYGRAPFIEMREDLWSLKRTIVHEIGHSLGLIHEHQRPDRNQYMIHYAGNVVPGVERQFYVHRHAGVAVLTEYDYYSVMHYRNCAAARDAACRDEGDPALHTITARFCHLDAVGGDNHPNGDLLTPLDVDGLRRAYMPRLFEAIKAKRSKACGEREFMPSAVAELCGPACAFAAPPSFRKNETAYEWGCIGLPRSRGAQHCAGIGPTGKQYIREWTDTDRGVKKCNYGSMAERWTECGCQYQTLQMQCTQGSSSLVDAKILQLSRSSFARDRAAARLLVQAQLLSDEAAILAAEKDFLYQAVFEHYLRPYFAARATRLSDRLSRIVRSAKKIDENELKALVRNAGLSP